MLPCKESNCVYGLIISGNIYEILWQFIKLIFNSSIFKNHAIRNNTVNKNLSMMSEFSNAL